MDVDSNIFFLYALLLIFNFLMPFFSSFLLFESDTEVKEPLMLDKVENIQILTPGVDPQGKHIDFFSYYSNLK